MDKQQIEMCPRCGKKPKAPNFAYCVDCKKQYDKERYLARKRKKNGVVKVKNPKTVAVAPEKEKTKTEELKDLEKKVEELRKEVEGVGEDYGFRVSVIEPPEEKPLFFDVDRNLKTVCRGLDNNDTIVYLFKGEAGTGKTTLIRFLQWKYKKPVIRVNVTVNTEAQELKGKYVIRRDKNGQVLTEWVDGLITTALRHDCWLQIEEVNFMQREHQSIFYSLFDERREIVLEDKGGEIIRNPKLVAFLTMNPLSFIKPLIPALKSRTNAVFQFSHLKEARQKSILIKKHEVPEELAGQIAKTTALIRKRYERLPVSSREAESWAMLLKIKDNGYITDKNTVLNAFKHTVALKITDDEVIRTSLVSVAEAVMSGEVGYDAILKGEEADD